MINSVLITGANRGLGFEFVKQLVNQVEHVFACCRSPPDAKELNEYANSHSNVHILEIDVTKETSMKTAVGNVSTIVGKNGLNLLINNSGIFSTADTSIEDVTAEILSEFHEVNTMGPTLMCKNFFGLLKQAAAEHSHLDVGAKRAAIVNINSGYGSINDCSSAGVYTYRMSKAGVSMLTKTLSFEGRKHNILCVTIGPGWVQTDMGGPNANLTPTESVSGMLSVLFKLTGEQNGTCWRYNGTSVSW